MTLDQVVAANVKRIRKIRRLSIDALAHRLGVNRHVVYDFEGRRRDRPQRPFRWVELVGLCSALQVTLFELVFCLPRERRSSGRG